MEEKGIPTVYIGSCRYIMEKVKPPRSLFVNFPLGCQCGPPHDQERQTRIVKTALDLFRTSSRPGEIVDLDEDWPHFFDFSDYMRNIEEMVAEASGG
jgi:hypothetical protein